MAFLKRIIALSIFDRMERQLSRTVDRTFAMRFTYTPMKATPNGHPKQDASRMSFIGKGIFEENPLDVVPVEAGRRDRSGSSLQTIVTGQKYELSVDRNISCEASRIQQGDRITISGDPRLYKDGARAFTVVEIKPDGMSRIVLGLVEIQ